MVEESPPLTMAWQMIFRVAVFDKRSVNPIISNIKLEFLLSCCYALLIAETGRIS